MPKRVVLTLSNERRCDMNEEAKLDALMADASTTIGAFAIKVAVVPVDPESDLADEQYEAVCKHFDTFKSLLQSAAQHALAIVPEGAAFRVEVTEVD